MAGDTLEEVGLTGRKMNAIEEQKWYLSQVLGFVCCVLDRPHNYLPLS